MSTDLVYLQLQAAKGIGPAKQRKLLQFAIDINEPLDELVARTSSKYLNDAGLTSAHIEALGSAREQAEQWESLLRDKGIRVIGLLDEEYPKRLKHALGSEAPPILATWGNLSLLDKLAVGFCGARDASDQGVAFTLGAAQQVAERGWVVVSGNARGIDATAHWSALQHGGETIVVVPSGILDARLQSGYRELATRDNILVLSEFQPDAHWSVSNAMIRNKTICGLSTAMIIVESGLSGGTYEAGNYALKIGKPLFVAEYANPSDNALGNQFFLRKGAQPIRKNKMSGRANMASVFKELDQSMGDTSNSTHASATQMSLLKQD